MFKCKRGSKIEVDHAVIKHDDADVDCCCYDLSNYLHVDSRRYMRNSSH